MPDNVRDYSETLFLPKTDFPMRAGLPQKEPEILALWEKTDLYRRLRAEAAGRPKFVLHDGPPYANGNIHIGHALNKILKDVVTRSQQMLGADSNYVPGWDCHGLPIEWKIEEENYRSKGKSKPDLLRSRRHDRVPQGVPGLCRALAQRAARGVQAARRRRRLGASLHHHGLRRRGADRPRTDEIPRQRPALSRLEAGDVVGGREDRARRGRGGVRGFHQRYGVGEVSGGGLRLGCARIRSRRCPSRRTHPSPARRLRRDLDDDTVDAARQPRHQLLGEDQICALQGHRRRAGQLGEVRRPLHPVRESRRRGVQAGARHRLRKGRRPSGGAPRDARLRAIR